MIRLTTVMALALATCLPGHAAEAARAREVPVAIAWQLTPSAISGSGTLDLRGSKVLLIGTASPSHVFRLEDDAQLESGKIFIPKGVELAWANGSHQIACEPIRVEHHVYFRCLLDSDGDGALDFALVASALEIASWQTMEHFEYLMGPFVAIEPIGRTSLTRPIPVAEIKETPSQLKVDIYLMGSAEKERVGVSLCASRQGYASVCTSVRKFALDGAKGESDQFGFHMVANVIPDGPATITVTPTSGDLALQ